MPMKKYAVALPNRKMMDTKFVYLLASDDRMCINITNNDSGSANQQRV